VTAKRDPYASRVVWSTVEFIARRLVRPIQLSSGFIKEVTEARVHVGLQVAGQEAVGHGCVYLSDGWAWRDDTISHDDRDRAMRFFVRVLSQRLPELVGEPAHPLELGLRLAAALPGLPTLPGLDLPPLARVVCGSPFDAAIHDGVGLALKRSSFDLYDAAVVPSADAVFPNGDAAVRIFAMLSDRRQTTLAAWWIVGRDDAPEHLEAAVRRSGFRCFKLKLSGNVAADLEFTTKVCAAALASGIYKPAISVDYNGACPSPEPVVELLDRLAHDEPDTYAALSYIEQPVPVPLESYPVDWRPISKRRPVIVDEGLAALSALPTIERQHWSGLALKTAKGHSLCIVSAAWALERGMHLTFQDLTNPGLGAIHTALFAARLPTLNGAEINSPQYTPEANLGWSARLPGLFEPRDGRHIVPEGDLAGLGSSA
jgi:hypothetical protein